MVHQCAQNNCKTKRAGGENLCSIWLQLWRSASDRMDGLPQSSWIHVHDIQRRQTLARNDPPLTSLRIFIIVHVWRHGELWCHIWPYFAIVKNSLKFLTPDLDHLKPATGRPSVPAFPCQRLRAFVCVLSELIHGDARATMCVSTSSRTMFAFEKTSVARVEHVLLTYCVQSPVTVEVNTLASKRSELIGKAAIIRLKAQHNPQKGDLCARVFQLLRVARKCRNARATYGQLYRGWPSHAYTRSFVKKTHSELCAQTDNQTQTHYPGIPSRERG